MNAAPSPLIEKLSLTTSAWLDWARFSGDHLSSDRLPSAEKVVNLLRVFLGGDPQALRGHGFLAQLRERFKVERTSGAPEGHGWVKIEKTSGDFFGYDAVLGVGSATRFRKHMVEAHELGHLFLAFMPEKQRGSKGIRLRDSEVERFCWEFALNALCPATERSQWNSAYVASLVADCAGRTQRADFRAGFSFFHLRALAQHHHISIRLTVTALDRHRLLDETEYGVAVLRRMPNPATGRDVGLRVMLRACPTWGFLVRNQRALKQGFSRAEDVFRSARAQEAISQKEQLQLRFTTGQSRPRWASRAVSVTCEYTAVDVQTEGRYLVAIWPWPKE